MIIACPACNTRYVVPDSAIGVDGRTVRCAKCRHSWFQDGNELAPRAPAPAPPPQPRPSPQPTPQPAAASAESAPPIAGDVRPSSSYGDAPGADGPQEARSSFDHAPPFRPRINRAKMWTLAASVFAVVSIALIGLVAVNGLPDWAPMNRAAFSQAQPGLVLDFPPNKQDRRTLPNGTEFFGASGTITNVGSSRRSVPAVLILLRDSRERVVYSWVVHPPKSELGPGESMTINEAVTDVPRSAKFADIGWRPG